MRKAVVYCRVATREQCDCYTMLSQRLSIEQFAGINPNGYDKYRKLIEEHKKKECKADIMII